MSEIAGKAVAQEADRGKKSVQRETVKSSRVDGVAVLARWFLGGLFIYMGVVKALNPAEFLTLVRQYNMVSVPFLLNSIAAALPWFEVFCGALMLTGVAVRGTALMLL